MQAPSTSNADVQNRAIVFQRPSKGGRSGDAKGAQPPGWIVKGIGKITMNMLHVSLIGNKILSGPCHQCDYIKLAARRTNYINEGARGVLAMPCTGEPLPKPSVAGRIIKPGDAATNIIKEN